MTNNEAKKYMTVKEAEEKYPAVDYVKFSPKFENIPAFLREINQFVGWKIDYRYTDDRERVELDPKKPGHPKYTKIPLDLNKWDSKRKSFKYGSSTDPKTYVTLEKFMDIWNDPEKRKAVTGLGVPFTGEVVGVDEDKCVDPETGEINADARARIEKLNSYTEYSVSGTGTHTFLKGTKGREASKCRTGGQEIYDNGRFFTFTGEVVKGFPTEIYENSEAVNAYYVDTFGTEPEEPMEVEVVKSQEGEEKRKEKKNPVKGGKVSPKNINILEAINEVFYDSIQDGDLKFRDLYTKGHKYCLENIPDYEGKTESEVDAGLLYKLGMYSGLNRTVMKEMFIRSSLYRAEKPADYVDRSIDSTIDFIKSRHEDMTEDRRQANPYTKNSVDACIKQGVAGFAIRIMGNYHVHDDAVLLRSVIKTGVIRTPIISGRTEIIGFSDNLDIDLNNTESNKFTHYKLRTGDITLFPEHGDFLTRQGIIKLIKLGMLTQEGDIKDITGYFLKDIQRAKKECPQMKVCSRPGWKRNKSIFVSGNYAYSNDGAIDVYLTNQITSQMYKKKGTLEGWLIPELIEWLDYESARFLFYCAFACYIASFLGVQNIVISMIGGTSGGKTLSASIAGSGMGRTDISEAGESIVRAANITQTAAEYLSVAVNGHYLVFDDATPGKDYSGLVYMVSNGRKKDRAPNSTLEAGEVYNAVYVITGEQSILKDTVTQGANGRVLEIRNTIESNTENANRAKKIESNIKEHYGHIAEPFLKKVFERKDSIRSKYLNLCNRFRDEGKDIGGRLGDQMACICIAGEIIEEIFSEIGINAKDPYTVCDKVIEYNAASEQKRDYWLRGLEIVYGDIEAWEREVGKDGVLTQNLKVGKGLGGNYTGEWLNVIETNIKDICERNHLDKRDLMQRWAEMGITRTDAPTKNKKGTVIHAYNKTVKIDGFSKKTISFNIRKVEEHLGYVDESRVGQTLTGVPHIDEAIFLKHVKDVTEAWKYLYNRLPQEEDMGDFCALYYGKYQGDSDHYTANRIMEEVSKLN